MGRCGSASLALETMICTTCEFMARKLDIYGGVCEDKYSSMEGLALGS